MVNPIYECISNFGEVPRKFSFWNNLNYLNISKPQWLIDDPSDALLTYFRHAKDVLCNGRVIWGHVIQANELLYKKGHLSCPGEVVYSLSNPLDIDPEYLKEVANQLFSLKGTAPSDPELSNIANYFTDEKIRVFGLPVPKTISPEASCFISTTYFVRKHIPGRRLDCPLIPIVVGKQAPLTPVMLPCRYWPKELIEWWSE